MRLLLIRHGETPANVLGALDTAVPGPGLTALGRRQAEAVRDALGGSVDGVYASVLRRTQLTARPLAEAGSLDVEVRRGLHEISAGALEGRSDRDAVTAYVETIVAWGSGELERAMPGGPDGHEFVERFDDAIAHVVLSHTDDATVAVVSHGAAIRLWSSIRAVNVAADFGGRRHLENTGVVVLEGDTNAWTLTSWAGEPVGGPPVTDAAARDPLGEPAGEVLDG